MAGLVPAIYVFMVLRTWMPGTRPGMTGYGLMSITESLPSSMHLNLGAVRHDWTRAEVAALFALPFPDLIFEAQRIHREHFDPREVQISTLLSIKTGGCPEDCGYCAQSVHYDTGVKAQKLMG